MNLRDIMGNYTDAQKQDAVKKINGFADKTEAVIKHISNATDTVCNVLDDFVGNMRESAAEISETMKSQNFQAKETKVNADFVSDATRDQKISFIADYYKSHGINGGTWSQPDKVSKLDNSIVDAVYKMFGGK